MMAEVLKKITLESAASEAGSSAGPERRGTMGTPLAFEALGTTCASLPVSALPVTGTDANGGVNAEAVAAALGIEEETISPNAMTTPVLGSCLRGAMARHMGNKGGMHNLVVAAREKKRFEARSRGSTTSSKSRTTTRNNERMDALEGLPSSRPATPPNGDDGAVTPPELYVRQSDMLEDLPPR